MVWGQRTGIGLLQGIALYTGAVLGTGVLALPALAARQAGPASLLAWAGLVLLSVPLASTFAALAGRYPDAGGVATFAARAFGPRWAAVTGWWFYCTVPVGVPVLGLFGGAYVAAATGGGRTTSLAVAVALVAVAVAANWVGLLLSGRLQLTLASLLAALLDAAIATSAPHRSEEHTSELQSRENLVCRLLLEKKKKKNITNSHVKKNKKKTKKK